jgi:hypothetical protein
MDFNFKVAQYLDKKRKLERKVDAFLLLAADYQMEQNVKWGESQFGHKVIDRQRQNFHEILVNDYFVENPVFDKTKASLNSKTQYIRDSPHWHH